MTVSRRIASLLLAFLFAPLAWAQTESQLTALRGLAPVSALQNSRAGRAVLAANQSLTAAIQEGTAHQPLLQPFPAQQQQSLRDSFSAIVNAADLSDGLGSTLGPLYTAAAHYTSTDGGTTFSFTSLSPAVAQVLLYAYGTSHSGSGGAKYFFGNGTIDGKTPASAEALAIFTELKGIPNVFGKTYGLPAGSEHANEHGNPRPFLTRGRFVAFEGVNYFDMRSSNTDYLRGRADDLSDSPSYPSGHTTYGYTEALVLALLVPQRYPQLVTRAAEYGNDRIIVGAHYVLDVLAARALATHDLAQLLAGKPGYVGVKRRQMVIEDYRRAIADARADLDKALSESCGSPVSSCALRDMGRFSDPARNEAFYESTQTYGLPVVHRETASHREEVGKLAPEAGYLLTVAFPYLTLDQANGILTDTEGPGGGFLDNGSSFGVYSRIDLYRAATAALKLAPKPVATGR